VFKLVPSWALGAAEHKGIRQAADKHTDIELDAGDSEGGGSWLRKRTSNVRYVLCNSPLPTLSCT
jgi:hypothetical protein